MCDGHPWSLQQRAIKRALDLALGCSVLVLTWWLILIAVVCSTIDTGKFGIFSQPRVGVNGRLFRIYKLRTMRTRGRYLQTTVTTKNDGRITGLGAWLRRWKLDELPQLWNVVKGEMSLVGPRPDVRGFADHLEGIERQILAVRPGITGPATLRFRNEEELLASVADPEYYNREVLFPAKVELNLEYVQNYSLKTDIRCLIQTIYHPLQRSRS